jgi:multiple sugar transport system permease protein
MLMTATMPPSTILSRNPELLPNFSGFSLDAFHTVFARLPFLTWMINTLLVSTVSSVVSLVAATLAGYSLSRWNFRGQHLGGSALLVSKLMPPSLIIIPLFIMFNTTGLIDTYSGLILANVATGVPLATWLAKGFFDRIPRELEQAAMIDGCSRLQALRLIILPLAKPGLGACGAYLILLSWSEFVFARTLMTDRDHQLLTVGLQSFLGEYAVDWPSLMAAGAVSLIPITILFVLLEPFLASGMTKGALAN